MIRDLLSQHDMLALFDRDRSSWEDMRHYPDSVTCRRILRFADWAARFPKNYHAARMYYEIPELSFRELAAVLGWPESTLRLRLAPVTCIDDPDDYSDIELAWNDVRPPRIPTPPEARGQSETYRNAVAVADFAALDETRWNVIRDFYGEIPRTQEELALLYRVGQATISRYLDSITTINRKDTQA